MQGEAYVLRQTCTALVAAARGRGRGGQQNNATPDAATGNPAPPPTPVFARVDLTYGGTFKDAQGNPVCKSCGADSHTMVT